MILGYVKQVENIAAIHELIDDAVSGLDKMIADDTTLEVHFTSDLSESSQTVVNDIVNNFNDAAESLKVPKIYDMVDDHVKEKNFKDIDYKTELNQSLIPVRTVVKGEVQKVDWYQSMNGTTPENKILTVDIVYTRDGAGFATSRVVTRSWINKDDSANDSTKVTDKYYFVNPSDQIAEGTRRRGLIVTSIQIPTMTAMMYVLMPLGQTQTQVLLQGRQFLDEYEDEFNKFVASSSSETDINSPDFGKKNVVIKLENEADTDRVIWLDAAPAYFYPKTIREHLIEEFSI